MDYPEWDIPDSKTINSISFEMYTSEEIKRLSVKPLTNSETFDSLLHPQPNGLHDLALGSLYNYICYTCGQPPATCTGHLGHIPLPLLLYNPMLYRMMVKILNLSCYKCHMLVLNKEVLQLIQSKISLIKGGHLIACSEISDKTNDPNKIQELLNSQPKLEVANDEKQRQIRHVQHEWKECLALLKETSRNACPHCSATRLTLRHFQNCQIFVTKLTAQTKTKIKKEEDDKMTVQANLFDPAFKKSYLTPVEVRERMRKVWEQNSYILKMAYDFLDIDVEYPTDLFFLEVIPVIPTCFRPCVVLRSKKFESVQTSSYKRILQESEKIQEILHELKKTDKAQTENDKNLIEINAINDVKTKGLRKRLNESWLTLQKNVNWLYDDSGDSSSYSIRGVRQILEKKDGLFRKHMMGKRVNYVARSVITPDPNIEVAEVGVPEIFAKTLTYPQPVTPWNVDKLRKMVINGPDEYPGATFVVDQHGVKQRLLADKPTQRESIANQLLTPSTANKPLVTCKKVYRHLINGDYLLLNRQPSLHKPSIQAHRARVLPNIKTFRLHYANCKAYNADFDGDEMTAHVPQNELGRAEAKEISSAHHQYVVPKDGSPLAGLIQDHVVAGVRLTIRGRFFRREEFNQLLFGALVNKPDAIKLLPPAIIRPEKLWSGKQLISTLLINIIPKNKPLITMESTSKIPERLWNRFGHFISSYSRALSNEMGESHVIIRDSELLCGVLDKSQYGSTAYGLVHCCYELYGGEVAANLLTCFGRLFTCFLQRDGFSLGIKDILMTEQADQKRKNIIDYIKTYDIDKSREELQVVVGENTKSISEIVFGNDPMLVAELDKKVKKITNDVQNSILRAIMPSGLLVKFPDNNLQLMINAGAKGSSVNAMQISCLLGQIELEGRRPPMMPSGRFLPSFLQYDISPQAGGFITGRFLTGISPQEFFVHCMAGREGLIDTTVKTSHSGYLQRCLVKHLEGLIVNYDLTVRDSDGSIIQFYYGEDSLDVTKTQFIGENHFPLLIKNRASILNHHVPLKEADSNLDCRQIQNKIFEIGQQRSSPKRYNAEKSAFLRFCEKKQNEVEVPENIPCMMGRSLKSTYLCNLWHKMSEKRRQKYQKKIVSCPDPVLSKIQPYSQHGTISEELYKMARNFCSNPDNSHRICPPGQVETKETITEENFEKLINYKFLQCMVDPGEAVGLISSQSVGEPSTQMTLNTFHFAGLGEMNVTLGIPRLREILFGTHFIKTPTMDIPVLDTDFAKIEAKKLQKKLNPVTLSQVLERVDVTDRIEMSSELNDRLYIVHFQFLHPSKYQDQLATDPDEILHHIETKYITDLLKSINSTIKLTQTSLRILPKDLAWTVNSTLENFAEPSADKENGGGSADEGGEENELPVDAERRDESKDSESSEDETDEVAGKLRKQTIDEHDYDDDNSDDDDDDDDNNSETERKESNTMEFKEDNDDEDNKEIILEEPFYFDNGDKKTRREAAKGKYLDSFSKAVLSYKYDEEDNLWCEVVFKFDLRLTKVDLLTIIKDNAETSVIHKVPGIKRSILTNVKTRTGIELHLQTEGINISYIQQFGNILDIDRFYCNSPMTMAQTYGIEAGLKVIIKEIQSVFGVYGIKVNYRHLSLIADYMAFEGQLIFFNQNGMQACPSPLQQITFESAYRGITNAASKHLKDYLHSPTSQLVTGKLPTLGTGHFDILLPLIPVK